MKGYAQVLQYKLLNAAEHMDVALDVLEEQLEEEMVKSINDNWIRYITEYKQDWFDKLFRLNVPYTFEEFVDKEFYFNSYFSYFDYNKQSRILDKEIKELSQQRKLMRDLARAGENGQHILIDNELADIVNKWFKE